jgi:hypothetical protein
MLALPLLRAIIPSTRSKFISTGLLSIELPDMSRFKSLVVILPVLIVLSFSSSLYFYGQYIALLERYDELTKSYNKLEGGYRSLQAEYTLLTANYTSLQNSYRMLNESYRSLLRKYAELEGTYRDLEDSYTHLKDAYIAMQGEYQSLVKSYEDWRRYAISYISFEDSVSRVLSSSEISNLILIVRMIVSYPNDPWRSMKELYDYVRSNIKYAYDPPIPYPPPIDSLEQATYIKEAFYEVILAPSETLTLKQGDCEDQAILLYALIRCYQHYIYGEEYALWLFSIRFDNGIGHLAVALPVSGGKLTILDTAGGYYTGYPWNLKAEDPYKELDRYSNWFDRNGGISTIKVYDVGDGRAIELISGSIYEVAYYIKYH